MLTAAIIVAVLLAPVVALVGFTATVARHARRLVPPCGRFVDVDGVRLHLVDAGEGPAVLMIHGLASQLQSFTYALQARLQGRYRLVIVDRPGCGYSQPAPSATLTGQAAVLSGLLRKLDIERALVVGHSLGGAVALAMALQHPEQVAGLALISPASQTQGEAPEALSRLAVRSDALRWLFGGTIAVPLGIRSQAATLRMLFSPDPVLPDFGTRGGALLAARPATYRNACRDLVEAGGELAACARRYGAIRAPAGVLFGRGDRILDPALHGESLRGQIDGIAVEMIAGGHMLPLVAPDACAAFIERVAARAGLHGKAAASA